VLPPITVASPPPVVVRVISYGPGLMTLLVTFLVGAATALVVQLVIQFWVVPKVETRKRREDRWERNVQELGDLLTTRLDKRANEAKVEQGKFRDVRELENESGPDQRTRITRAREQQAWTAQQAMWAFSDLLRTRIDWLIGRIIRSIRPPPDEIVKFDSLARHYQTQAILVGVPRPQDDDRTESAFENGWAKERDARMALIKQVEVLADLPHPPRASWLARRPRRKKLKGPAKSGAASR